MDLSTQEKAERIRSYVREHDRDGAAIMTLLCSDGGARTSMFMVCLAIDDPKEYPLLFNRIERAVATLKLIGE